MHAYSEKSCYTCKSKGTVMCRRHQKFQWTSTNMYYNNSIQTLDSWCSWLQQLARCAKENFWFYPQGIDQNPAMRYAAPSSQRRTSDCERTTLKGLSLGHLYFTISQYKYRMDPAVLRQEAKIDASLAILLCACFGVSPKCQDAVNMNKGIKARWAVIDVNAIQAKELHQDLLVHQANALLLLSLEVILRYIVDQWARSRLACVLQWLLMGWQFPGTFAHPVQRAECLVQPSWHHTLSPCQIKEIVEACWQDKNMYLRNHTPYLCRQSRRYRLHFNLTPLQTAVWFEWSTGIQCLLYFSPVLHHSP